MALRCNAVAYLVARALDDHEAGYVTKTVACVGVRYERVIL